MNQPDDEVVPRYLIAVDGRTLPQEYQSEGAARVVAESAMSADRRNRPKHVEVVRSVLLWMIDEETGTMLLVGEKLKEQPV